MPILNVGANSCQTVRWQSKIRTASVASSVPTGQLPDDLCDIPDFGHRVEKAHAHIETVVVPFISSIGRCQLLRPVWHG